jgi:hypothetical protein
MSRSGLSSGFLQEPKLRLHDRPHAATVGGGGAILDGWQVSTIVSVSSGFPRTACVGTDRSNTGGGQDYPNVTGQDPILPAVQRTIARRFNTDAMR